MSKYLTDYELGTQHGRMGNENKYPNNGNYAKGFAAGTAYLQREIEALTPLESYVPSGTNDADITQFHA